MKKIFTLIAICIMSISVWGYDVKVNGIYYHLVSKTNEAEVTSGSSKYTGTVVIPESIVNDGVTYNVTSIGNSAFYGCDGLTSVTIPNSVTSIGYCAFSGCSGLPVINNIRYADTYLVEVVDKTLSSYIIKEGTRFIAQLAFCDCKALSSVTIPNSVTNIEMYAFANCSGMKSVEIPNSVKSIEEGAFYCCSSLTSVTIPNSVTKIEDDAFGCCSGLTSVIVDTDNQSFCSEDNVIYTKDKSKLVYCISSIKGQFVIPNSVTNIGTTAFDGCKGLTSVIIPNSVKNIEVGAFESCTGLTSVTIPNSVTSIGNYVFSNSTNIKTFICIAANVLEIESGVFNNVNVSNATLIVPEALITDYKKTAPWSDFGMFKTIESCKKCAAPEIQYKDNTIRFSCATEGATVDYSIKPSAVAGGSVKLSEGANVALKQKYTITCTAIAEGYTQSDLVTKEIEISCGDIDGDGKIDVTDVSNLVNKILNK